MQTLLIAIYLCVGLAYFIYRVYETNSNLYEIIGERNKVFVRKNDGLPIKILMLSGVTILVTILMLALAILFMVLWPFLLLIYQTSILDLIVNPISKRNKKRRKEKEKREMDLLSKLNLPDPIVIPVSKNIFNLDTTDIFYVEGEYNPFVNSLIQKNYSTISKKFSKRGYRFVYLPKATNELVEKLMSNEFLRYNYPHLSDGDRQKLKESLASITTVEFSKYLMQGVGYYGDIECGFIRKSKDPELRYLTFSFSNYEEFNLILEDYIENIGERSNILFSIRKDDDPTNKADYSFNVEANVIAKEILERIEKLKQQGFEQMLVYLLNNNVSLNNKLIIQPSRLHITEDFRIFLPDYDNLEIVLTPLPKAVFLLFLQYPDGIQFKYLSDYRDELMAIYKQISLRENYNDIISSIDELVNPTKNSINEKCSRIKEAFVKHFTDNIAKLYYITGDRGKRKAINIDRTLVQCDAILPTVKAIPRTQEEIEDLEERITSSYKTAKEKLAQKDYLAAIEYYTQTIALNPLLAKAYADRAFAYSSIGNYADGERDNTKAIEIDPRDGDGYAFHNRAEDRFLLGRYNEALSDITHYLQYHDYVCRESYFLRGLIYEKLNNLKQACQNWVNAKDLGREGVDAYLSKYPEVRISKVVLEDRLL